MELLSLTLKEYLFKTTNVNKVEIGIHMARYVGYVFRGVLCMIHSMREKKKVKKIYLILEWTYAHFRFINIYCRFSFISIL